jgi:hypothetical protein
LRYLPIREASFRIIKEVAKGYLKTMFWGGYLEMQRGTLYETGTYFTKDNLKY